MGRLEDAREIIAKLRAITPEIIPMHITVRRTEDRELYLSGLRLAMGETPRAMFGQRTLPNNDLGHDLRAAPF